MSGSSASPPRSRPARIHPARSRRALHGHPRGLRPGGPDSWPLDWRPANSGRAEIPLDEERRNLLKANAGVWSLSPGLLQPVFQGGRIKKNYEAAKARYQQALAQYQKSALNGYREVADSLVTIEKLAAVRAAQQRGVTALQDASRLSRTRYDSGLSTYLEVLFADEQLFQQELQLAQTRGAEMRARAQLYRALGGGWQPEAAAAPAAATK